MKSLSSEIKSLIAARIESSSPAEILRIGVAIAANEQIEATASVYVHPLAKAVSAARFTKLLANGKPWLDPQDGECVAVYDSKTNLTWTRGVLEGRRNWTESLAAAAAVRLFGKDDWRAPTLEERLSINDYTRHSPALDTEYFAQDSGWEWTSTPDAESPSVVAWFVGLGGGDSDRGLQSHVYRVRAVRAGQQFALGI